MEPIERFETNGCQVSIEYDAFACNPRVENDNLGTILYTSTRYKLGDERVEPERIESIEKNTKDYIILPVYTYMHGNIALRTQAFSCPWDSGQSGIIYVSKAQARKEYGILTKKRLATIYRVLEAEVAEFSAYLNGEIYFYTVERDGEYVDSCGGFIGDLEYVKAEAIAAANRYKPKPPPCPLFDGPDGNVGLIHVPTMQHETAMV